MYIGPIRVDMPGESGQTMAESLAQILAQIRKALEDMALDAVESFGWIKRDAKGSLGILGKALDKLASGSLKKTTAGLKRALMGFDELNRLSKNTASGGIAQTNKQLKDTIGKILQDLGVFGQAVDKNILEPVTKWGKQTLTGIIDRVRNAFSGGIFGNKTDMEDYNRLWSILIEQTEFWNVLTGQSCDSAEQFGQVLQQNGADAQQVSGILQALGLDAQQVAGQMENVGVGAQTGWDGVTNAFGQSQSWFDKFVADPVGTTFDTLWNDVNTQAQDSWSGTKLVFSDAGSFMERTFSDAWGRVNKVFSKDGQVYTSIKEGVLSSFKKTVNGLIDGINMVIAKPFTGLNQVLENVQKVKIGNLQPFASLNWRAQVPKIPHLAAGAVLPANKPFLAVVGDQRHGTNVETPLSTIQEAMAAVMADYTDANMAGHNATVQLLRQILEAVLGIHISDEVIANAYDRYQRQMGVVRGR